MSPDILKIASLLQIPSHKEETVEKRVKARLAGLKIGPACSRCGGAGHYSRNAYGQTHCYACNGGCVRAPATAGEWSAAADEAALAAGDGTLDRYLLSLKGRRVRKSASGRIMSLWKRSGVSARYNWTDAARARKLEKSGSPVPADLMEHLRVSRINDVMCAEYGRITSLTSTRVPSEDALAALPAALERAERVVLAATMILDTDLCPTAAHVRGDTVFIPCGEHIAVVSDGVLRVLPAGAAREEWRAIA